MIRFLNLKDQITDGVNDFAFYDTICDQVLSFNGQTVFSNVDEFEHYYKGCFMDKPVTSRPLKRFTSLIPNNFFGKRLESNLESPLSLDKILQEIKVLEIRLEGLKKHHSELHSVEDRVEWEESYQRILIKETKLETLKWVIKLH